MAIVYVGVGTNCEREKHVHAAIDALSNHFGELIVSSVFESEAVGFEGAAFYNLVVGFNTVLGVTELSTLLKCIEDQHGRQRGGDHLFTERTLDIDILLYDDLVGTFGKVQLPRKEILENAFVLWPLSEVAPDINHPAAKKTFSQLWQAYDKKSQQLSRITLPNGCR